MNERITAITEMHENDEWEHDGRDYEGYAVTTTHRTINIGITAGQQCCEGYGHISTPDDPADFVGADLIAVNTVEHQSGEDDCGDYHGTVFVNIETNLGQLQLAVYNHHNGYYGHGVEVWSSDDSVELETGL